MNKKRVVILVMCSSTLPLYDNLKNGIKETWFNHRNDDVEIIFYSDNVNYSNKSYYPILEGNDLILPCDDGVHNCGIKTILALDWVSKNYKFDYIYRSNLGAYINIKNLLIFLSDKPKDKFYCGIIGEDNFYLGRTVRFASGSGYFLSKDLVDLVSNNKESWNHRAIDDVALGDFMERFNININESARRINLCSGEVFYNIGNKTVETIPDDELYHFRLRSDNRDEDLKNMKEIHEKITLKMKNNIYINIAMIGSVNQVLWDLLTKIKQSGLYDAANKIYLVFNGDRKHLAFNLVSDKYVIIDANPDISKCEFPTLDLICEHCKEEDLNVLYLHTKGVTKPGYQQIIDWTNLLSHFNIVKWQDRLKDLEENDCSGINFFGNPDDINLHPSTWGYGKAPLHYSGNFWWSKSSHIKKLPNMSNWLPDNNYQKWRVMAEMWLCQITDGNYFNAFSSDVDHYQNLYPKELYV